MHASCMKIFEGSSGKSDAVEAVGEAAGSWGRDAAPDMLFVFHSSVQNPHAVAASLADKFPNTLIVGCTTAGEWLTGQHKNHALVLTGISTPDIRWAVSVLEDLSAPCVDSTRAVCTDLVRQLDIDWGDLNADDYFCLSFFDGLSKREEPVIAAMASELGDVPLLGGSSGDDLKFDHAFVIANGKAWQHAAVFILAESRVPFRVIKHQHYIPGDHDVVITKANMAERVVNRLDGMPAAQRYAQLLGLEVEALTPQIFSDNPLAYPYGNECYVRALRRVCEDDALEFGCAIEEGMVLTLCQHQDMAAEYDKLMAKLDPVAHKIPLLIVCNCIYRALEGMGDDLNQQLAEKTCAIADHMIGFDTYGEQWQGLHINQTMVALALGAA